MGPSGSGKSTLLDAICLALFGATPRLRKPASSKADEPSDARRVPFGISPPFIDTGHLSNLSADFFLAPWTKSRFEKEESSNAFSDLFPSVILCRASTYSRWFGRGLGFIFSPYR
ncbi:MAG TPA: hypothetical protein EYQ20_07475 [candidate division Zixibacteria bacterium]|nr:hypothetical protein [candidate division Zixibacteria bacterium]